MMMRFSMFCLSIKKLNWLKYVLLLDNHIASTYCDNHLVTTINQFIHLNSYTASYVSWYYASNNERETTFNTPISKQLWRMQRGLNELIWPSMSPKYTNLFDQISKENSTVKCGWDGAISRWLPSTKWLWEPCEWRQSTGKYHVVNKSLKPPIPNITIVV